jgi:hypothetical protein
MSGAILQFPLYASMAWTGKMLPFNFLKINVTSAVSEHGK